MKILMLALISILMVALPPAKAAKIAGNGVTCYQQQKLVDPETGKSIGFNWCFQKFANTSPDRILYFFHGAGGNEMTYLNSPQFQKHNATRSALGIAQPVIVSISFGPLWVASEKPSQSIAGNPRLLYFISDTLMPFIETSSALTPFLKTSTANGVTKFTGKRFLMGESMGGFNSAQFAAKKPGIFEKVVLGCPGFFTFNPFSPTASQDIEDYIVRTHASRDVVDFGLRVINSDFSNAAEWNSHDPLQLVAKMNSSSSEIFVWYNTKDQFGFQEGALAFKSKAAANGVRLYQPAKGDVYKDNNSLSHCVHDSAMDTTMTQFLQ